MSQESMRVLVLGTGPRAVQARKSLVQQGVAVAQRLTKTVTHVLADDTVAATDPRLERARREGVKALPPHFLAPAPDSMPRVDSMAHADATVRNEPVPIRRPTAVASAPRDRTYTKPEAHRRFRFIGSPVWALLPLLTLGFAAPIVIAQAAHRLKSVALGLSAAGYGLAIVVWLGIITAYEPPDTLPTAASFISLLAFLTMWLGATVQAFLMCRLVRAAHAAHASGSHYVRDVADAVQSTNSQAVALMGYRRELRYAARTLVARDMAAARELGVGRPDLPSDYDDGGLIDVNHAPIALLTSLAGITPVVAEQIITRRLNGGFGSSAELVLDTDLDPAALPDLDEYAVFIR